MRILKLILPAALAASAAYAYKRFVAGPAAGHEETAQAQPFSSEEVQEPDAPVESGPVEEREDPLTHPTWLKPADAS
jgi:hypothetical protein